MLTKKVAKIGFETIATVDRRPFGIDALSSYPVFPPEFVAFLRRVVPADRHDELVWSVVMLARKPEAPGGFHAG